MLSVTQFLLRSKGGLNSFLPLNLLYLFWGGKATKEEGKVESQIYSQCTSSFFFSFSPEKEWTCQIENSSYISRKFSPVRLKLSRNCSRSSQKVRMGSGLEHQHIERWGDSARSTHREQVRHAGAPAYGDHWNAQLKFTSQPCPVLFITLLRPVFCHQPI